MARKNDRRRGVDARGDGANLHLASVIGPGSRKPAGWQVADHMRIPRITLRTGAVSPCGRVPPPRKRGRDLENRVARRNSQHLPLPVPVIP